MQKIIVGIDEVGRGPLAGPVVAAAFCIVDTRPQRLRVALAGAAKYTIHNIGLRDSKQLTPKQRERIYAELRQNPAVQWGIGQVSEKQIDKINILQATRLAMKKAVLSLERKLVSKVRDRAKSEPMPVIDSLIIDGNILLDLPIAQKAIIKADTTVLQCMAASIVAKVTRDRLMQKLHEKYPVYGFARHKGYGTKFHVEQLRKHGPCPIHRLTFAPCR